MTFVLKDAKFYNLNSSSVLVKTYKYVCVVDVTRVKSWMIGFSSNDNVDNNYSNCAVVESFLGGRHWNHPRKVEKWTVLWQMIITSKVTTEY